MTSNLKRRDFVKSGAMAASALTAFHVLPTKEARAQQPLKVGVVGCGGRGRGAMTDAIKADGSIEIVAIADIFPDKFDLAKNELEKLGKNTENIKTFLGFKAYQDLMQEEFDYVILTTPPCYRPETLEAAVEAGKHVFMEKPAAVDAPGIRRIIAAGKKAKEKGLSVVAGTQRRHQLEYHATIEKINEGLLGEVNNIQVYWCGGPIGFPDRGEDWSEVEWQMRGWYHWLWLSGDHILEQHVHNIDVANWVMGSHPVKAYGSGGRSWQEQGNIWDHHAVNFEYPNGLNMLSMCSQYPRETEQVEEHIQGSKGSARLSSGGDHWIKDKKGETLWKYEGERGQPYVHEHEVLQDSIRNDKKINEAQQVAESTMTAMMGRMAEYSGKILTWDEALNDDQTYPIYYELGDVDNLPTPIPGGKKYTGEEGWKPG